MSWTWSDTSTLPIETPWMWPEQGDSTGTKGGCKMSQNKASRATERKREGERRGKLSGYCLQLIERDRRMNRWGSGMYIRVT